MPRFRKLRDALDAYPELRPLYEARSAATLARIYDHEAHQAARAAFQAKLDELGIEFSWGRTFIGFGSTDIRSERPDDERRDPVRRVLRGKVREAARGQAPA